FHSDQRTGLQWWFGSWQNQASDDNDNLPAAYSSYVASSPLTIQSGALSHPYSLSRTGVNGGNRIRKMGWGGFDESDHQIGVCGVCVAMDRDGNNSLSKHDGTAIAL